MESKRLENDIVFSDDELAHNVRGSTNSLVKIIEKSGERHIALVEALIIGVGTLIWGFGNLI